MKKLFVISILSLSLAATPVSALAASSNAYTNGYNYVIEEDPQYNLSDENMNLSQYKNAVKSLIDSEQIVRINNLLVSEDWAAIHYWSVVTDTAGNKTADDHMSFLHFVENDGALKVDMAWTK